MAVWLGKQYLGQTDEVRHEVTIGTQLTIVLPRPSDPGNKSPTLDVPLASRRLLDEVDPN